VSAAKQNPHRPDIAPAFGLRAGVMALLSDRRPAASERRATMWFPSLLDSRSTREKLAVGSAACLRSPKTSLAIAVLAIAAMLSNPSSVQAGFRVSLGASDGLFTVSAFDPAQPVTAAASGAAQDLSATAGGFAGVGPLGVSIELGNTIPFPGVELPLVGSAGAEFDDTFTASLPGLQGKAGTLVFTLGLQGGLDAKGDFQDFNHSQASVHARFSVTDQVPILFFVSGQIVADFNDLVQSPDASKTVNQVFTVRLPVLLGLDNQVRLASSLSAGGIAISQADNGSVVTADLSHTFSITSVQLFDDQGQFIKDVSMTDSFGNTLQVGPLEPVPEPSTLTLLGMGTLGLLGYSRRRVRK
jgi:hypothetical protein